MRANGCRNQVGSLNSGGLENLGHTNGLQALMDPTWRDAKDERQLRHVRPPTTDALVCSRLFPSAYRDKSMKRSKSKTTELQTKTGAKMIVQGRAVQ